MVISERKPKFRSRKLDFGKALQVFRFDQAVDLDDYGSPLRGVAQVATGVDKEEEDEHHLKAALSAAVSQAQTYYIPTPQSHPPPEDFDKLYLRGFKLTKQLVKWSGRALEELLGESPRYDADEEDLALIEAERLDLEMFEWIMESFEELAHRLSPNAVTLDVLERLRHDAKKAGRMPDEATCENIRLYWLEKRTRVHRPLVHNLKHDDLSAKIGADPYVCFRRREIKAPRKTRRTDAQCIDKLKKLHYDLGTSKALLEASLKRDRYKKESLVLETSLFEQYWALEVWRKQPGRPEDWPLPDVPSFRVASQSVLEPKKKKLRPAPGAEPGCSQASLGSQRTAVLASASVLKSTKYFKPYYPVEVLRQIQKDMDLLLVDEASRLQDSTGSLGAEDWERASYVDTRKRLDLTARLPCFSRFRLGRGGMLQLDRMPITSEAESRPRMVYNGASRVKLLSARDCSHLHNAFVGNYNQHYIQTTNGINQPLSFNAWIAATAAIAQQSGAARPGTGKPGSTGSSPKKMGAAGGLRQDGEITVPDSAVAGHGSGGDQQVHSQPSQQIPVPAGLTSLQSNSQITVKVKSRPNP